MADKFPDPKVGDPVAFYSSSARGPRPTSRCTIERVTATQVVVAGTKFKRTSGDEVGGSRYGSCSARPWDAALDARLAELDLEEANAAWAVALFKRIAGAATTLQIRDGRYGGTRVWTALELERLHALVQTFEDGAAVLKATLEPDFVPESKS